MQWCFNTPKTGPLSCVTSPIQKEKIKIVIFSILNVFGFISYIKVAAKFSIGSSIKLFTVCSCHVTYTFQSECTLWPTGSVFVYELSGSGFESSCSHLIKLLLQWLILFRSLLPRAISLVSFDLSEQINRRYNMFKFSREKLVFTQEWICSK